MYIRANDKLYEIDNSRNETDACYFTNRAWVYKKDVVKQSNTIEELSDGFIGITTKEYPNRPDIEPFVHYFQKPFEFMYGNNIIKRLKLIDTELKNQNGWSYTTREWFKDCDIYAFIRTSKGLIYVTKMNENGELELI